MATEKIVYLKKANSRLVGNCKCNDGRISYPPQMDCPWCGCGWLFTCISCRKAFTFAVGVEIEADWEALSREDWSAWGLPQVSSRQVKSWIKDMRALLADVKVGETYVCLDGVVFPQKAKNIKFDGLYARHELKQIPHAEALKKKSIMDEVLGNPDYWRSRRLKRKAA